MDYVAENGMVEEENTEKDIIAGKRRGGRRNLFLPGNKLNISAIGHLRYFYEVARLNSFTLAAKECDVSQSAISQHIQALEKDIGAKLISRNGRKITLTPAGRYFYDRSKVVVADYERLCSETRRIDGND